MKIKMLVFLFLTTFATKNFAQERALQKANTAYENYAYIDALKIYESVAAKGYKSVEMFQNMGNAYYFNGNYEKAALWYEEMFSMNVKVESEYYYRYAQTLKSIGNNEKADKILSQFYQILNKKKKIKSTNKGNDYLKTIQNNSGRFTVENADFNSKYSDFGTTFLGNKLVFTSSRDSLSFFELTHNWTNQYFTNIYLASFDSIGKFSKLEKWDKNINSKFNESSPIFTKDGSTLYFTRNNYLKGKRNKSSDKATLLKLYKANLKGNIWTNVKELPFNDNEYSVAHPALSPDGKTLYFASNMPGTLGQSDLFRVTINVDGTYGKPENLGSKINTSERETFPFISDENELYFASDGHSGLGGLDIFVSKINDDGSIEEPINIGAPANSPQDDFAFWMDVKTRKGYFSSNRPGGKGFDDIYKFTETRKLNCEQLVTGKITDDESKMAISNATVVLLDEQFHEIQKQYSDENGLYSFKVKCGLTYYIRIIKQEFDIQEQKIEVENNIDHTTFSIKMIKTIKKIGIGDDLAKVFGIKTIYFDLDKFDIRPEAAFELEKIVAVLKANPTMKVAIKSHTDSRQSFEYNLILSDKRAKSTANWIISNGIDAMRLSSKGYGESQLINSCSDGIQCTEEEHQANRRSEFVVIAL
jgi:outer membrane protein OmpA-like peptidoglycan-associated protein/tetratricopeptide (TPR) repeat protein